MSDIATAFADEVVTNAYTKIISVPGIEGPFALITLDNGFDHTKPSSFGPGGLAAFDAALDEAFAANPVAIAVTGKPFIFAAGADLKGVPAITSREQGLELGRLGHKVFRRLRESSVPTFAFINGVALGGGLEVGLHSHYRTVAANAGALGLPEAFLGLVPGWGGTQLLPNLVGPSNAVTVVIENSLNQNKVLSPKKALELGVVDVVLDSADFIEQSLAWASQVLAGTVTPARPEIDRGQGWDDAIARAKAIVDGKTKGNAPGAVKAVELLELARSTDITDAASLDKGFAAEDEALADLLLTDELRAGLYAFDLVNKRAKRPAGAPDRSLARKVSGVGIVGAGLMASQLALLFVRQLKVPVILTDIDQERIDKGVGYVHTEIEKLQGKGRLSPDAANRLKRSSPVPSTRPRSPRPTSSSKPSSRTWTSRRRSSRNSSSSLLPKPSSPPTPLRSPSRKWRPASSIPSVWSASTSSTVAVLPLLEIIKAARPMMPLSQRLSPPRSR